MKSRGVYETPGGTILLDARRAIESITLDKGEEVYEGMIIGEHNKSNDLEVNPLKGKKLTNVRASGHDEALRLTPPKRLKLEEAISYIKEDELVEITPLNIRLRKKVLDAIERKKNKS